MAPKIVDDDDVMAKQEIIGTHFMSLLIMFDVYTSKKVWMKCGRWMWFADKAMSNGFKCALSDFRFILCLRFEHRSPGGKLQGSVF